MYLSSDFKLSYSYWQVHDKNYNLFWFLLFEPDYGTDTESIIHFISLKYGKIINKTLKLVTIPIIHIKPKLLPFCLIYLDLATGWSLRAFGES